MERPGEQPRTVVIKETVQVTHIVVLVEEYDGENQMTEKELILSSNRRPIPVPYSEEP